ncbi:MAG: ribokinase [Nitrospira sp.]|jgi:ribokinase|uniref:ribokinase n=1 Tax=Nitrospira sp. ND1 TaxID=1658518 RepID=UPI0009BAA314|nr:ribokinase [Nitrospira sp. ND1]MBK7418550.1 ribokinase [Nitrospira sp.]OYT24915.1 MAG: ribokinase [Nitrospira sp. UW-LDO-02]MBK7488155.1 ribokinase [Nitrospira sp.]MBK8376492.1 ribokinase [Nitrospira sp.]MBK9998581.1 ribokinase [Nitrospira sp.]
MILVVGSSNIDLVASVDRLPSRGETVLGYRFAQSFGGKGANQAVAAARAGAEVAFLSKLGADANGRLIEQHLAAQGLSRPILLRDAEFPTGVAMILVDHSGENQIAVVPGSNGRLTPADLRQHRELIAGARVLLLQMEIPRETVFEALRLGRECGLTTILNPAPAAPLPSDLLRLIDILTPNESEAQALTGSADPAEAARILTDRGVGTVVVTCGANGAFLATGNDVTHIPGFLVETIDSTGAGDAFNGAVACAVAEGVPIKSAIVRANAAGALATTGRGAQESMPTKDDIEQLCRSGIRQLEPPPRS